MCDAVAYTQIIDAIYPKTVTLSKLNFQAKTPDEFTKNLSYLNQCFHKAGIDKVVPIDKLSKGKF